MRKCWNGTSHLHFVFSLSLSLFFASSSWHLAKLHGDPNTPPLQHTNTHKCTHTYCCLVPKQHWRPKRYKQVSAAHRRQFIVAPLQLSTSVGQDQRYLVDLGKSKGDAVRPIRFHSDQAMLQKDRERMSWGCFPSPCEHKCFSGKHNRIVETTPNWHSCIPWQPFRTDDIRTLLYWGNTNNPDNWKLYVHIIGMQSPYCICNDVFVL